MQTPCVLPFSCWLSPGHVHSLRLSPSFLCQPVLRRIQCLSRLSVVFTDNAASVAQFSGFDKGYPNCFIRTINENVSAGFTSPARHVISRCVAVKAFCHSLWEVSTAQHRSYVHKAQAFLTVLLSSPKVLYPSPPAMCSVNTRTGKRKKT